MRKSTKSLISVIVFLSVAVVIIFSIIFISLMPEKEKEQINKNPSSIQDRKDALKEVFK